MESRINKQFVVHDTALCCDTIAQLSAYMLTCNQRTNKCGESKIRCTEKKKALYAPVQAMYLKRPSLIRNFPSLNIGKPTRKFY